MDYILFMDLTNLVSPAETEIFLKLIVAMFLGMVLGIERVAAHKVAGMRTYALVSLGSALYVIISDIIGREYAGILDFDPVRMASQIVVGIGFLGTGLIIFTESRIIGLTTAAGLWMAGGIGIAAGYGMYSIALAATIMTLFVFTVMWMIEQRLRDKVFYKKENGNSK